jgi:hypothetical protein
MWLSGNGLAEVSEFLLKLCWGLLMSQLGEINHEARPPAFGQPPPPLLFVSNLRAMSHLLKFEWYNRLFRVYNARCRAQEYKLWVI